MSRKDRELLALGAMLSMGHQETRTEYVTREVHEHRAPTDDSIRLAKEYEEKIWKDITDRVTVDIPSIDASYVQTEESHYDRARHIFFKVNGRPVRLKYEYQQAVDQFSIFRDIAGKITEQVMELLMCGGKI
jgi:hypothetical protein